MKKTRNLQSRAIKAPALSRVGLAVLASLAAGGAMAAPPELGATTTINATTSTATASGFLTVDSVQTKSQPVSATAAGQQIGITVDGVQTGTSNTTTQNTVNATAKANEFSNAIDLSLTGNTIALDGAASLGVQTNTGAITSNASGNSVGVNLNGFSSGGASNTQNTIAATTVINGGASSVTGTVPVDYVSNAPGITTSTHSAATNSSQASGSIVVTTAQQGTGPASSANASGNAVTLDLTADGANAVSSAPALDGNTVSATLKGNAATNTASIQAGGAPTFAGSAVVSNLQLNQGVGVTHNASNTVTSIDATIGSNGTGTTNVLNGALSVQGNTISSAATGNEALGAAGVAGNRIVLADGISVAGSGGPTVNSSTYSAGSQSSQLGADLAILNTQGNVGVALQGATNAASVTATVQSIDGGAATVSGNAITSAATGNAVSSAIATGQNGATFSATAALANQQSNFGGGVSAVTAPSIIGAATGLENGTTKDSTVAVEQNRAAASAYGNSATQSLSLAANALPLGAGATVLSGGRTPDGNVSASGAATITSLQSNYASPVSATLGGSYVGAYVDSRGTGGDTITGSTVSASKNTQEAVGLANSASNTLSLAGTSIGSGAGIANIQVVDAASPVSTVLAGSAAAVYAGTHITDTSLTLSDNLQRSIAYGNSTGNTLTVAANGATVPTSVAPASTLSSTPSLGGTVTAAYGLLNNQSALGDVDAQATGFGGPLGALTVLLEGNATRSQIANQGNAFVAAAYGNDASNAGSVSLGTGVDAAGAASIANVTSAQTASGAVSATATGGAVIATAIQDNVSASTVATSGNQIQALAFGSRGTNSLSASGNGIDTASATPLTGASSNAGTLTTNAAFSVQNAQSGAGSVTATQRDGALVGGTAAGVLTAVGGNVTGSSIASNDNVSTASATSNAATNSLGLSGNGLSTTTALQNSQTTSASVNALIGQAGVAGSAGTAPEPFTFSATGSGLTVSGSGATLTLTGGTLTVLASSLSPAQLSYLTSNGWTQSGGNVSGSAILLGTISLSAYSAIVDGGAAVLSGLIPGTPATPSVPNQGGVILAVSGAVTGSQLSVNGNSNTGSVTGNSATNTTSVTGNSVAAGSGRTVATAGALVTGSGAQADNALSNLQSVTGDSALVSNVYGSFAVDTVAGSAIGNSTVSVSNNSQRASSVANTATNTLGVTATNLAATSALASQQSSTASVAASSDAELYAPGAVSGSSVALANNRNVSLGVINDATNALTVTAGNATPVGATTNAVLNAGGATGDHVLSNSQAASTSVASTASTRLYNQDRVATATTGLVDSTFSITGNATTAEASANRADNSVTLSGAALQGSNAGLSNAQTSSAAVNATSSTAAGFNLEGGVPAATAALNSGLTIDSNSTTALARGNAASNVLNVSAGSSYATPAAVAGSTVGASQAAAAVLNNQGNTGNVSSSATASYQVALNATAPVLVPGVSGSTVAVTGNTTAAQAYGNTATNSVNVSAPSASRPTAAVGNFQTNSGTVVATATSVNYGIGVTGAATGSTLRAAGNQVSATAVGNSAVSTIASVR